MNLKDTQISYTLTDIYEILFELASYLAVVKENSAKPFPKSEAPIVNVPAPIVNIDNKALLVAILELTKAVQEMPKTYTLVDEEGRPINLAKIGTTKVIEQVKYKGGGGGGSTHYSNIIPAGLINGSNTSFLLPRTPDSGTLKVYSDGVRLTETGDYTLAGTSLTLVVAPTTNLLADFQVT